MTPRVDLSHWEAMYDTFDDGHRRDHIERVRNIAESLAKIHCPNETELAYVAATLHDIGLANGREGHEANGAETIASDPALKAAYSEKELALIVEAVREHRASSGNPVSAVAKVVSDADKTSDSTRTFLQRAYGYGLKNYPDLSKEDQVRRAAEHIAEKFGPGGTGTRLYFKESEVKLKRAVDPIISALEKNDLPFLTSLVTD